MTTVAFLGTGTMGAPMARNLLAAGFDVRAWNRTRSKAEPLAEDGAVVAGSPAEAGRGADVLVTMLLDAESTAKAAREAVPELRDDAVWAQMGTIGIKGMTEVAAVADGVHLVDAPVLGTEKPARLGKLKVLAAGPRQARDRVQPVFDAVGEQTLWLGDDPAQALGTRLKLAVNSWVLALTNAVGESVALAESLGVDPRHFLEAIEGTATDSPYAHVKGNAILGGEYTPSFALRNAFKDANLITEVTGGNLRLDVADACRERFRRALEAGHGDEDMAAAYFASFSGRNAAGGP
ncbi:NAD(P)-dependent oxidoreductase [Saccharopolyspora erythraea]|uniref:NAD(P)-dependent oxidoreductase n=1 Tax=Saccharopolyspora erythraea TaxID=1836 RepID=UPI001BAB85A3|nr:NAD(P)-dependent oxidoreductase [Saccharopolyspora erythraea]QUH00976.1 NAD(P)-dependent oxidoreductase [Saccharopolyspora erythraea]